MGNFSNAKSRVYPLLQTIRSMHNLAGHERTRVHVIIKMQFLEFSYSNEVEIKRLGSLVLYEYDYEIHTGEIKKYEDMYREKKRRKTDTIGTVNHYAYGL